MEHGAKVQAYRAGRYKFKVPPVCAARWDEADWIKWVDACNGWLE